jgi:hypothetical protein
MNTARTTKKKNQKSQQYWTEMDCSRAVHDLWEQGWEVASRSTLCRLGNHTVEFDVDPDDVRKVRAIVCRVSQEGSEELARFSDFAGLRASWLAIRAIAAAG